MEKLTRRGLIAGAAVTGLVPASPFAQTSSKRGGTLNTILTPEPPILVLGVNNQGPTAACRRQAVPGLAAIFLQARTDAAAGEVLVVVRR